MPNLRDRSGTVKFYSSSVANKLLQTGQYQLVTNQAPPDPFDVLRSSTTTTSVAPVTSSSSRVFLDPIERAALEEGRTGGSTLADRIVAPSRTTEAVGSPVWNQTFGYFLETDAAGNRFLLSATWQEMQDSGTFDGFDIDITNLTPWELEQWRMEAQGLFLKDDGTQHFFATPKRAEFGIGGNPISNPSPFDLFGTDPSGGGSGDRGGSGAAGISFIAPDREAVREQVKAYVVATTGTINEAAINDATDVFLASNREAFDRRETQQIDPWLAMQESVRGTSAYKAVNDGRPASIDEMAWVTGMQGKLRQVGVSAIRAEDLGINLAIAGASDEALIESGQAAQFAGTGRLLKSQRDSMKQSASAVLGLV